MPQPARIAALCAFLLSATAFAEEQTPTTSPSVDVAISTPAPNESAADAKKPEFELGGEFTCRVHHMDHTDHSHKGSVSQHSSNGCSFSATWQAGSVFPHGIFVLGTVLAIRRSRRRRF